jgi:hypothetical protein
MRRRNNDRRKIRNGRFGTKIVFLGPPASELPSAAAPDDAAQQGMIEAARTYVAKTLPQLPDLSAIRTTDGNVLTDETFLVPA